MKNPPDKIYLERILCSNEVYDTWKSQKTTSDDIEYVRKDAFIEKMFNFLSEKYLIKTKEPLRWVPIRQVIEDFKKYMEK